MMSQDQRSASSLNQSQPGWWDFISLVDPVQRYVSPLRFFSFTCSNRQRRPICWTKSSVIFTPHPVQPLVLGRVFSSSKKFTLPLPLPIRSSPQSYEPPTLISVSPDDTLLFAYFPAHYGLIPVAVLWKRGLQIDEWVVKEFDFWKPHHLSDGIVAVSWTTTEREVCIFKRDFTSLFTYIFLL
jgi:hypothetical protein